MPETETDNEPCLKPFKPAPERCAMLVSALRAKAQHLVDQNEQRDPGLADTAELLNVLARMVQGKTVYQAFGAPGDWGYGTPIGDALQHAYS